MVREVAMEWVSVEDKLPEKEGTYLIAQQDIGWAEIDHFSEIYQRFSTQTKVNPITHWMHTYHICQKVLDKRCIIAYNEGDITIIKGVSND